jgi:hypothetical protein
MQGLMCSAAARLLMAAAAFAVPLRAASDLIPIAFGLAGNYGQAYHALTLANHMALGWHGFLILL